MALFMDLVALSNGLHGSVQMDSVALFSWIGWLRHHGILICMNEVSVTITAGEGCEEHNHGLEYRSKLEHTHDTGKDTVIELVPYEKSYKEQINELMKPYIKERNEYTLKRKAAAWDRYNSGQIKTKPRNRDYPLIGNDYYTQHLHDQMRNPKTNKMEQIKMFRSLIIGLGDKSDRENGKITKEQALHIFNEFLVRFKKGFSIFPYIRCHCTFG